LIIAPFCCTTKSNLFLMDRGLYLKSFAKLRVRKSATCEWYCERSLSDMRNTIRMLLACAHATLRMTSNKAPLAQISVIVRGCLVLFHGRHPPSSRTWTRNHRPSVLPLPHNGMDSAPR
jgi:hypothetical protein